MITVRPCEIDEGPRIAEFIKGKPFEGVNSHGIEINWDAPVSTWLMAEDGEKILGVVMLAICPPLGMFESMVVDPELRHVTRARVVARLVESGYAVLRACGCSAACCFIPDAHDYWRKALRKRGAKVAYRGEMLIRSLVSDGRFVRRQLEDQG